MLSKIFFLFFGFITLFAPIASSNAGIPMLAVLWPLYWALFIPIILIEWYTVRFHFKNKAPSYLLKTTFVSNAISTFLGIPITWGILVLIQLFIIPGGGGFYEGLPKYVGFLAAFTVQIAWILPYGEPLINWIIPTASTFLMIIFFFTSYFIEKHSIFIIFKPKDPKLWSHAMWRANIHSYIFLYIFLLGTFIYRLLKNS